MKTIKKITALLIIASVLIMNVFSAFSAEKPVIPQNIKIGLFFDKTAKTTTILKSKTEFSIGDFENDEFKYVFSIAEKELVLRKDIYTFESKINSQYNYNSETNISNVDALYHLQIGQNFATYDEALIFLNALGMYDFSPYLVYEGVWKIFIGSYLDKASAFGEIETFKLLYNYEVNIVEPLGTRVQVVGANDAILFMYDSTYDIYLMGRYDENNISIINVEGTNYRGAITAKRLSNSDMTIINKLFMEDYLYGVVPSEMPALWPIEALKAQAVAARGFAFTNFNKYKSFGFNLCSTINSQVYKGYGNEHPNTNKAVDETKSKTLTFDGKLVQPYYHSNSGGFTEDSENIWTNPLPYIRGVKDDFSVSEPNSTWSLTLSKDEVKNRLEANKMFIGDVLNMKILSTSNNGRVLSLQVYGTNGSTVLEKEKIRTTFGLRSTWFLLGQSDKNTSSLVAKVGHTSEGQKIDLKGKSLITSAGIYELKDSNEISIFNGNEYMSIGLNNPADIIPVDAFVLEGKGFGHGLGMSQYGARRMAELNYKFDEILTYYYTGVKVE